MNEDQSEYNVIVDDEDSIMEDQPNFDFMDNTEFDPEVDGPLPPPPLAVGTF